VTDFLPTPAPAAPVRTKACDGCGKMVPITERKYETGLCLGCQKTAEDFFGVAPDQAGIAVLAKKKSLHYFSPETTLMQRDRVRRIILATMRTLPNATKAEQDDAEVLRAKYPDLGKSPLSTFQPQADFLEGLP